MITAANVQTKAIQQRFSELHDVCSCEDIVQRNVQWARQEQAKAQTGVTASLRLYDWLIRQYQRRRADVAEKGWQLGLEDPIAKRAQVRDVARRR